jgi:hypothetical protein
VIDQITSKEEKMDHETIIEETKWVCGNVVDELLKKTGVHPSEVTSLLPLPLDYIQLKWRTGCRENWDGRTSISRTKKAQITFPLRHFSPLKVIK